MLKKDGTVTVVVILKDGKVLPKLLVSEQFSVLITVNSSSYTILYPSGIVLFPSSVNTVEL